MAGFLLVKEANKGDAFAQHELALRYIMGNGFAPDTALGISWLKRAVKSGIPAAHFNYAIMLFNGTGVDWNPFEAFYHIKYAAVAGMPEAMYLIGLLYTDNLIVNRNLNLAFLWLDKASKKGFLPAKNAIDEIIKNGFSPPDNLVASTIVESENKNEVSTTVLDPGFEPEFISFDKDSSNVDVDNSFVNNITNKKINEILDFVGAKADSIDLSVDSIKAFSVIKKSAEFGSPEAAYAFAKLNANNNSKIEYLENLLKALRLGYNPAIFEINKVINSQKFFDDLLKKVNQKNSAAQYVISMLSLLNLYYEIPFDKAIELLKQSAAKNNTNAINELAIIYFTGKYNLKNKTEAIKLWQSIYSYDNEAKQRLIFANLIENPKSITKNDIVYLKAANDNGSVISYAALGYVYEKGIFTTAKKALAEKYYRKGAARGNNYAYILLKNLYNSVRPNEEEFFIFSEE